MPDKILIVEDDRTLLETLEYNLARQEYAVYKATDGRSAPRVARQKVPDLVILDLMLPGLDGLGVSHPAPGDERADPDAHRP